MLYKEYKSHVETHCDKVMLPGQEEYSKMKANPKKPSLNYWWYFRNLDLPRLFGDEEYDTRERCNYCGVYDCPRLDHRLMNRFGGGGGGGGEEE